MDIFIIYLTLIFCQFIYSSNSLLNNQIFNKIKEVTYKDDSYSNVVLSDKIITDYLSQNIKNGNVSAEIPKAAKCHEGFVNNGPQFDLHNFEGDLYFSYKNMEISRLIIKGKYGEKFICKLNAHDEIEKQVKNHVENVDGKFHRHLSRWNFDLRRTVYHFGNGTHAYITFVCLPGYHLKLWHDLHLRTHVHVRNDGKLVFHDKMRSCECTPESCSESVKNYFHIIGAKISNSAYSMHLEETICSKKNGGSPYGGFAELTQDDVLCEGIDMELEDDAVISHCVVTNKPKCVFIGEKKKEGNPKAYYMLVTGLSAASIVMWLL